MWRWKSKYLNFITPCAFVVFVVCSLYFMNKRDKYIEDNGVWTILHVGDRMHMHVTDLEG